MSRGVHNDPSILLSKLHAAATLEPRDDPQSRPHSYPYNSQAITSLHFKCQKMMIQIMIMSSGIYSDARSVQSNCCCSVFKSPLFVSILLFVTIPLQLTPFFSFSLPISQRPNSKRGVFCMCVLLNPTIGSVAFSKSLKSNQGLGPAVLAPCVCVYVYVCISLCLCFAQLVQILASLESPPQKADSFQPTFRARTML